MNFIFFEYFVSKLWRAIPNVPGYRLSNRKWYKVGGCALLLSTKYEPHGVETDRDVEVGRWWFFDFLWKVPCWWRHCRRCECRINFRFSVGHDINRSTCIGEFLVVCHFCHFRWASLEPLRFFLLPKTTIFCEKYHVGDVTVGGASVVSTSSFRFPVGHDLNRSMCSGEFLVVAYFRRERCWKVGKKVAKSIFPELPALAER